MYYEHIVRELSQMVGKVDKLSIEKDKLDEETRPDQVLFRKKSKVLKLKLKVVSGKAMDHSNNLFQAINEKNQEKDWERLLDMKLEQSKIEMKMGKAGDRFRRLRQKHYEKMAPFMKKKRAISKDAGELTGKIFERIRRG